MSNKVSEAVERVMKVFNDEGAPENLSKEQFVEMCEEIESQVQTAREATQHEIDNG